MQKDLAHKIKASESYWTVGAIQAAQRGLLCTNLAQLIIYHRSSLCCATEDGTLHLQLCKAEKVSCNICECTIEHVCACELPHAPDISAQGEPWRSALAGHGINFLQAESETKRLLLERFQEEVSMHDVTG